MCTKCFSILNRFEETRLTWIANQHKLEAINVMRDENTESINEDIEMDQLELMEDSQGEYEYPVEYVDELEFGEDDINTSESIVVKTEISETAVNKLTLRTKFKKKPENTGKGKEVYRKLLQKCSECSKMIEKNRMEGHLNKHRNIRPYICEDTTCGKTFFCKLLLRLHRTSIHTDQTIECNICSKTFKSERSLYTHNLRHKNENRYECTYCDRKFNNNNSLFRHLAIHSGVREFNCEQCTASFYRKFNLGTSNILLIRRFEVKTNLFLSQTLTSEPFIIRTSPTLACFVQRSLDMLAYSASTLVRITHNISSKLKKDNSEKQQSMRAEVVLNL